MYLGAHMHTCTHASQRYVITINEKSGHELKKSKVKYMGGFGGKKGKGKLM